MLLSQIKAGVVGKQGVAPHSCHSLVGLYCIMLHTPVNSLYIASSTHSLPAYVMAKRTGCKNHQNASIQTRKMLTESVERRMEAICMHSTEEVTGFFMACK